ncbi:hypothetical protein RBB50_012417 [Rhinocladiella similis]
MNNSQFEAWGTKPTVSYPSRSRTQLESENEELSRKVQVLQEQCRTLATRNQELTHLYLKASCHLVDVELPDCCNHLQHVDYGVGAMAGHTYDQGLLPLDVLRPSQVLQDPPASDSRQRTSYTQVASVQPSLSPEPQLSCHYLPNLAWSQNAEPSLDGDFSNGSNQYDWQGNEWGPQATSGHNSVTRTNIINDVADANDTNAQVVQLTTAQVPDYTLQDSMWLSQPDAPTDPFQDTLPLLPPGSVNSNVENDISKDDGQLEGLFCTPIPMPRHIRVVPDLRTGYNSGEASCKLDQYINALYQVLSRHAQDSSLTMKHRAKLCAEGVLWVVREAWPEAAHFWKTTASFKGFLQSEMWRNFPNEAVYSQMHPSYCPTLRQLTVPHSPLIDWLPWPELREKLIEQQDNFDVDLVCKIAIQNVIAHRTTTVPGGRNRSAQGPESTTTSRACKARKSSTTSFRIWDLCLLEEKAGFCPASAGLVYIPSSAEVKAIEKAYSLEYNNFETQKLHSRFFETFPTLFARSAVSNYVVQDLPVAIEVAGRDVLGTPQMFSPAAGDRLQNLVTRVLETPC